MLAEKLASLYPEHLAAVRARHDRALAATEFDSVVIYGGAQRIAFLDDNAYPFRVNPHLKWWAPVLSNPHCLIHYKPGNRPRLFYYQPVDFWHMPASDPIGHWVEHFEIITIANPDDALKHLQGGGKVAFVGESDLHVEEWKVGEHNPQPLVDHLHFQRTWKTDYELECMREANRIGVLGHRAAERAFREGASEFEIHLAYLRATLHNEHELPYGNIIALNQHGAVLHYQHQERRKPEETHAFLIDAGAHYNGYASDITRTYSRQNDEFAELIEAMDTSQLKLVAMVKPGVDYRDIQFEAHRETGRILRQFDFIDVDGDAAFEKKITHAFFPHGVGHFLGLQVHDVAGCLRSEAGETIERPEGHPFLRLTRVIEEKQVFTIEPGIYFVDSLLADLRTTEAGKHVKWDKVDAFRKFGGIRIEDDVAVTSGGCENMTRDAFRG